jgi:hypothetical protein
MPERPAPHRKALPPRKPPGRESGGCAAFAELQADRVAAGLHALLLRGVVLLLAALACVAILVLAYLRAPRNAGSVVGSAVLIAVAGRRIHAAPASSSPARRTDGRQAVRFDEDLGRGGHAGPREQSFSEYETTPDGKKMPM